MRNLIFYYLIYSNSFLLTSQNTDLSNKQIFIQRTSPASSKYQSIVEGIEDSNNNGGGNALDIIKSPIYKLPTYTVFPPVRLPSFQEWKQQGSGKREGGTEVENRLKWEFPPLQPTDNHEGPQLPKINIFPQQQPKGLFFKDKEGRFNYADASCGAKVLKTNKSAKSKNNILKKDKDSYLMNECSYSEKFIEIELCDTIWVTSVILGNLELYSSNFKEIKISASKNYPPNPEDGWNEISTYTSNNWKQLQRFNTVLGKSIKKQFVKYLRIDLLSHYGNEFYCPVTQVIVHGVTMLEDHRAKGKSPQIFEEEEEAIIDENASKTTSESSENESYTTKGANTPPPSPTQNEMPLPPKPVELPKEPSTVCTLTEEILNQHQVHTDHYTTTTSSFKQASNSSQSPIRSIPPPNADTNTQNETTASKTSDSIKPTESPFDSSDFSHLSIKTFNNMNFCFKPVPPLLRPVIDCPSDSTYSEPSKEAPKPITMLTPLPSHTESAQPSTSQISEAEAIDDAYDIVDDDDDDVYDIADDDDDDDHDNVFKTITQRLTKLEREFELLQDYLQIQTTEFNKALLDFQEDQREQLIKSYLFLNSTLNRELYALRRLQGEGWSRLMEVIDIVGDRSKNEVNSLREELNTIQFIVKWLVLGEFILILGLIIIYIIFNWLKSNNQSSSTNTTSGKSDLKLKVKQN